MSREPQCWLLRVRLYGVCLVGSYVVCSMRLILYFVHITFKVVFHEITNRFRMCSFNGALVALSNYVYLRHHRCPIQCVCKYQFRGLRYSYSNLKYTYWEVVV
jgi:hypothetical protein